MVLSRARRRYHDPVTNSPASRRASVSRARRTSTIVLTSGIVLAGVLAVASLWVPWLGIVGVVVASVAGVVALTVAGRELLAQRAERNAEAHAAARAQNEHLRQVRADHSSVMEVLTERSDALRGELRQAKAESGELRGQVSRLRGDNEALRVENTDLRAQVAITEALVTELSGDQPADVVALPRRRAMDAAPSGWRFVDAETVIDLDLARLATPFVEDAVRRHAN